MYVTSKAMITGRSSLPNSQSLPNLNAQQPRSFSRTFGKRTKWFDPSEKLDLLDSFGANRFTARPKSRFSTAIKLFPTYNQEAEQPPSTTCAKFVGEKQRDGLNLIQYMASGQNAFKTNWIKHKSLKDSNFFPELHPEWQEQNFEYNLRRDRIVRYREEMLMAKHMTKTNANTGNRAFK
jgi:hypothetical protein